jgi:type IV secretion system protein TrbJ
MKQWWVSLAIGCVIVASTFPVAPSHATDAVLCVNCGSEVTQVLNKLTMLKQLATQAQQLQTQIGQYQNMLTNTKSVTQNLWGNTMADLQRVNTLFQQSKALAYTVSNLDSQFAQRYGGFNSYLSGKPNFQTKYQQWSQEASNNNLYALKAAGLQNASMSDENALMQQLQGMSGSAQGQKQAIQVANMIAAQNVSQIQKLRQLVMTQVQLEANYYQQLQDRQDAEEARHRQFISGSRVPNTDGRQF